MHGASELMQPGLEVAPQPGLEVAPAQEHGHSFPEVRTNEFALDGKEPIITKYPYTSVPTYPEPYYHSPEEHHAVAEPAPSEQKPRRRPLWLVVGIVAAVVVILAAVLGGVLGSRAAKSSSSSAGPSASSDNGNNSSPGPAPSNSTGSSNTTTTTPPLPVRKGSSLAITGWRKSDGSVASYLFYQDPQDGLRYSKCDTSHRTPGNDSSCWESPVSFNSFPDADTPLAASTIIWGDQYEVCLSMLARNHLVNLLCIPSLTSGQPQIELFYAGFKTRLLGVNFNDQSTPPVGDDSVNKALISPGANSSLAAYWPWTLYQDGSGVLFHVRNLLGGNFGPSGTTWDNNKLNVTALASSRLAVVPMSANFSRVAVKGGYAVFYQLPDGHLAVSVTDLTSPELDQAYPLSWPATLPSIALPKRAPFAGFSVARGGDALQRVDSYILYLDAAANINVLYTDSSAAPSSSGSSSQAPGVVWKTAQPAALKGVDADTDIACLTMPTSFRNAADVGVLLEQASDDATRCYFQKGGAVVEAKLSQGNWVVVGTVPMA